MKILQLPQGSEHFQSNSTLPFQFKSRKEITSCLEWERRTLFQITPSLGSYCSQDNRNKLCEITSHINNCTTCIPAQQKWLCHSHDYKVTYMYSQ